MSLAFVQGIHRWPVNSPQKGPVTREMFPFDDVIMNVRVCASSSEMSPKFERNPSAGFAVENVMSICVQHIDTYVFA